MEKAAGFQAIRQFAHKAKHRREAIEDQKLVTSRWDAVINATRKVDVARVNWPGLIGVQRICGMFDPKPRLVKRGVRG